jgi:hypothetical protein
MYCCMRVHFRGSLPSNEHLLWLRYSGVQVSCHSINVNVTCKVGKIEFGNLSALDHHL